MEEGPARVGGAFQVSLGLVGSINRVEIQKYKILGAIGDVGRVSSSSQGYRINQSPKKNKNKNKKQNKTKHFGMTDPAQGSAD